MVLIQAKISMNRNFQELSDLETFLERFNYLSLVGVVGESTFGSDRYLNQRLYRSPRWASVRSEVIVRDNGCDLGHSDYPLFDTLIVHHMNPITPEDIRLRRDVVFDPDGLICTSLVTHQAIHFGDENLLPKELVVRRPGDTTLW